MPERFRELFLYIVFGALTTLVNYTVYIAWISVLPGAFSNLLGTLVAWAASVLFAYITNRRWVFSSRASGLSALLKECAAFFAARAFSGILDLGIMYAAVDIMGMDGRIVKLASNIMVIIVNYALSKFIVFKGSGGGDKTV